MSVKLRLVDFNVKNDKETNFRIQIFGLNAKGETYSIFVNGFTPFFYVKVKDSWGKKDLHNFLKYIKNELRVKEIKKLYKLKDRDETLNTYTDEKLESGFESKAEEFLLTKKCKIVESKTLYGFDCGKKYKFIKLVFGNMNTYNTIKNMWYDNADSFKKKRLREGGYEYKNKGRDEKIVLYEAKLPALLRFFHIQDISPSGWVEMRKHKKCKRRTTICKYEFTVNYKNINPLRTKETPVPYKICSFDIEASSSHGDFPLARKSYRKMLGEIITYWNKNKSQISKMDRSSKKHLLKRLVFAAFEFETMECMSKVYLKKSIEKERLSAILDNLLELKDNGEPKYPVGLLLKKNKKASDKEKRQDDEDDEEEIIARKKKWHPVPKNAQIIFKKDILYCLSYKFDAGDKLAILDRALEYNPKEKLIAGFLPELEGDKCTFIGSTFLRAGDIEPYLNHCVVLNTCEDTTDVPNSVIESYETEREMLLGWRDIIQKEDPDIIIGYNIFGFDYIFMHTRAEELGCLNEFMQLSRNTFNKSRLAEKQIRIASGTHNLSYLTMEGRIQIDLYNHFRREVNLPSYKLDYVASHFIGDYVKKYEIIEEGTKFKSYNLTGLQNHNYVSFELIGHSSDSYKFNGKKKFQVVEMNETEGWFKVKEKLTFEEGKKIRWGLAKDDVTPQDIFRLTNGSARDRAIIAKYCFQDCNLVHHIFRKNDILTGFIEIGNVCSVPIDYIVMRGQGIKLLSFLAKECRSKNTLMPVLEKVENDGSYEGAICLPPKSDLYLDNPIAVVDYSSLYPSSMISENISHDSKVRTKEYDLNGRLIKETGTDTYDNLPEYKYVDVTYDTYEWKRPSEKKKEVKIKVGYKVCRFAQFPDGRKAILPEILTDLLAARKATRKKAKYKTVKTTEVEFIGLLKKTDTHHIITTEKHGIQEVYNEDVLSVEDTYDDYMKNVFNQRQLGIKVTANSMYGQCGARTSAFYEKDIAASTTATGRKLLLYGKKIIEDVYGDTICETKYGKVRTKSEVVYGDSVTPDTPLMLRNKTTGHIEFRQIDNLSNEMWRPYEGFKVGETNRREKQQNCVNNYEIYTSKGWSNIIRVIRHKTVKKMYRITTHTGVVDVTEDHSLLDEKLNKLKPKDVKIGMSLCHNYPSFKKNNIKLENIAKYIENIQNKTYEEKRAFIWGFFYGDGSCGKYNCPSGKKYSWALNQKDYKFCTKLQSLCMDVFGTYFKINNTIDSSNVYKIVPNCGNIKKYVEMFQVCYNKDKHKIIPVEFLNGDYKVKYAYLSGYYAADGSKCKNEKTKCIRMDNKGKIGSAMLYYLNKSLGFNVSVNTRKDKRNIIRLTSTSSKQRKDPNKIKKIEELGVSTDFVYDIETEVGNFNTGFALIVKNTDSCFMSFNVEDLDGNKIKGKRALELTIELAIEAGKIATKFLKGPHDLEYEKTFMPFCLLSKKRYVGMLYEHDPNKCKRKSMGIVLKRRDNAPIVKDIYGGIIDILMNDQSIDKAVEFTKNFLQDIVSEKFSLEKLIISKSLREFYKNPDSIAHKVLADRIGKRDPGNKPSVGSRVPYVYIQTKGKVTLQGDKIESPSYIVKNKLKPDYTFYITNQIMKPVQQVFGLVLNQIKEFKPHKNEFNRQLKVIEGKYKKDEKKLVSKKTELINKYVKKLIFEKSLRKATNIKNNQKSIKSFFK